MLFYRIVIVLVFVLGISVAPSQAQESVEDSLKAMVAADGLEVTLFAAEPDLRNPTSMDIDAQGRVWVAEATNYRLFNQKEGDPRGDRIRVLEDTNGDGRCDKATTFYQDPSLQAPIGIAVLGNRVYVCQSPDLFYLEDTDGDGRADKKTVVLTGFKGVDHDHAIHGIMFGMDGRMYFSVGDRGLDVTDKSGHRVHGGPDSPHPAATVLRSDLDGENLELLAWNLRNPYEPTVNSFGTTFISDNDDDGNEQTRICYIMRGGNYGYWREGGNGRRRGNARLDSVHWNMDRPGVVPRIHKTGFGSPTGMLAYEGDGLPGRINGSLVHADAGPGVIRSYRLRPDGAGYAVDAEVLLSSPGDKWFRPSDVTVAPDGSLLVADWYDPGVGGHRMGDYGAGRIYRLARPGTTYASPTLDLDSDAGIRNALQSPNLARRFLAHQKLESVDSEKFHAVLNPLWNGDDAVDRARALWLLANGPNGESYREAALRDSDARIRTQAIRILGDAGSDVMQSVEGLLDDSNPAVRRQIALELARHPEQPKSEDWLLTLQARHKSGDAFYRNAMGIAMRGRESRAATTLASLPQSEATAELQWQYHSQESKAAAIKTLADTGADLALRQWALRTIEATGGADSGQRVVRVAMNASDSILQGIAFELLRRDEGQVWKSAMDNSELDAYLGDAIANPKTQELALRFALDARRGGTTGAVLQLATDTSASVDARKSMLRNLERLARDVPTEERPGYVDTLIRILTAKLERYEENDAGYVHGLVRGLGSLRCSESTEILTELTTEVGLPRPVRVVAMDQLSRSQAGENRLLRMAEDDSLPTDLVYDVTERLHRSRNQTVRERAAKWLPREETVSGETLPRIADLAKRTGDIQNGRAVFLNEEMAQCARCHTVRGEGGDIGPDLSNIGEKLARESLFESIVNPNAGISHEYKVWIFESEDEGVISGFIRSEDAAAVEIMDASGEVFRLRMDDINERVATEISLMPTGLASAMEVSELVDLVAYLETLK